MADVETGEAVRDRDDKVGDRRDEDEEMNGVEKGRENGKHERSPSLKSRSPSPADARAADSRSRSPVRNDRSESDLSSVLLCLQVASFAGSSSFKCVMLCMLDLQLSL